MYNYAACPGNGENILFFSIDLLEKVCYTIFRKRKERERTMKVIAKVVKEIEVEVDDKFNILVSEDFWNRDFEGANQLSQELIEDIYLKDCEICCIEQVENSLGELLLDGE